VQPEEKQTESTTAEVKEEKKVEENHHHDENGAVNGKTQIDDAVFTDLEHETGRSGFKSRLEKKGKPVDEYIRHLYLKYEKEISALTVEIENLKAGPKEESTEPYVIKSSTKNIIEMVEKSWVEELREKTDVDEKISRILSLFLIFKQEKDIPNFKKHPTEFWNYCKQCLAKHEDDIIPLLNAMEGEVEKVPLPAKIKMEKLAKQDLSVLNASTFDSLDALSGVLSFMLKEVTEYMGLVQQETKKGKNNNDKILKYGEEKADYFNKKQDKLIAISKKYNISTQ